MTAQSLSAMACFAAAPTVLIFASSNIVNLGNLAFNMVFSRWMGPELFGDLALVLTIKLALLGVLAAVQMATSQIVAERGGAPEDDSRHALARLQRGLFVALWLALPLLGALLWRGGISEGLGLSSPALLLILVASLPFWAPLSILRGIAFGEERTGRIVLSANAEMAVRLAGSVLAWQLGLGLEGVVAAIVLSIVAGWAALVGELSSSRIGTSAPRPVAASLAVASVPFAALQLAQVLALDGELFIAKAVLHAQEAGYAAALSLFQRIQFFACFALASVLLPGVTRAVRARRSVLRAAAPVGVLYLCVALPFLLFVEVAPDVLMAGLVGSGFEPAAAGLRPAAISASAFTLSYLLATFLAALGTRRGVWLTFAVALAQLGLVMHAARRPGAGFLDLVALEAACQVALCIFLFLLSLRRIHHCTAVGTT